MDLPDFLVEPPPDAVMAAWRVVGGGGVPLVSVAADLAVDGEFGAAWLLVGDGVLAVVAGDDASETRHWPLAEVERVHLASGSGAGALEATIGGVEQRLLVFTNTRRPEFAAVVSVLKRRIDKGEWDATGIDPPRRNCPSCGRKLAEAVETCPHCIDRGALLRRILIYALPHRRLLYALFGLMALSSLFGLVTPLIFRVLTDEVIVPVQHRDWLIWLVLGIVGMQVLQSGVESVQGIVSAKVGSRAVHDLRADLFRHLQTLSLSFYSRYRVGNLIARVNSDTGQLQSLMTDFIPYGISSILTSVGILALLIYLSPILTLWILIPLVVFVVLIRTVVPRFRRYWQRLHDERARLYSFVTDTLNGVRVVKAFGREAHADHGFRGHSERYRDTAIDAEVRMARVFPLMRVVATLGTPIVWLVGGYQVFNGSMTFGDIVAYNYYLIMLYQPIHMLARLAQSIPNSLAAGARVFEVLDSQPDVAEAPDAVAMPDMQGRLELRDVTFGYEPHKPVLDGVCVTIEPGEMIGLVGHSGAGKSTTINLICRLYDPQHGAILIDGVDMRQIKLEDLHRQIGIVLQETFLLNGSIAENIAYTKPEADPLSIIRAARVANAHDFIARKADAYDTEVSEGGGNLSGGEKQRVSIARAVLSDPRILILDEATSSVDLQTEKSIQEALSRLVRNRTTIAIAHRLSTLKNANRLIVLDKGKVEEIGTHEELVANDGTYAKLARMHRDMSELRGVSG